MPPDEMDLDSDDEIDEEWMVELSERLLDEFEDVSSEEKAFMKLWNRHTRTYTVQVPLTPTLPPSPLAGPACRLPAFL